MELPSKRCLQRVTYWKNVTHGLPIIRTSVDHGTAFDIAWQGEADHMNMVAALDYAYNLATGSSSGSAE